MFYLLFASPQRARSSSSRLSSFWHWKNYSQLKFNSPWVRSEKNVFIVWRNWNCNIESSSEGGSELKWNHHTITTLAARSLLLKWQFLLSRSIVSIFIKAEFDFQSRLNNSLELFFIVSYSTPTAVAYFSYHLIIIAVCTIASFRWGLKVCEQNGTKLETSRHLFNHVLLSVSPSPLSSGALALERSLICEVNWHARIRTHVVKSNSVVALMDSHRREKNASLKCLIPYNYLIIPREWFPPVLRRMRVAAALQN